MRTPKPSVGIMAEERTSGDGERSDLIGALDHPRTSSSGRSLAFLPEAPWFEQGASWSARRVLAHLIAETAKHAGHADIIRESIDGPKTMG